MKITTAGESHGKGIFAVIEGLPAGLRLDMERINAELKRRQGGFGRSERQQIERDKVIILSGARNLKTLASPLTLAIENMEYLAAEAYFSPEKCNDRLLVMSKPRPGHCDLAGMQKFGLHDARNVAERASARETAARVAAGAVCKLLLEQLEVFVSGYVRAIGSASDTGEYSFEEIKTRRSACLCMMNERVEKLAKEQISAAQKEGETLGGVAEIRIKGLKSGFGSCMTAEEKLDARLAGAFMGVQAIKGVEVGLGFAAAQRVGSEALDAILSQDGALKRPTNYAGGIEGGMSNGEEIVLRAAMKPLPSLQKGMPTVDVITNLPAVTEPGRSDVCAVPACEVVLESVAASVICSAVLSRLGGDTLSQVISRYRRLP